MLFLSYFFVCYLLTILLSYIFYSSKTSPMGIACSEQENQFDPSNSIFTPLFDNNNVRELAAGVSARLATTYDALSKLYPAISVDNLLDEGEDEEELNKKVKEIFKPLTYEKIKSDGPICNAKLSGKAFVCFECNRTGESASASSVYCEDCFVEDLHKGHYFTVYSSMGGLCDCGNDEFMKKQSFCKKHKTFDESTLPDSPQIEMYEKEIQFLIFLFLRIKRQRPENVSNGEFLWQTLLGRIKEVTADSYLYQNRTSRVLLRPLPQTFKYEKRPLIEIVFPQKWGVKTLQLFENIYLQLYPVEAARKKILFELIKVFSLPNIDSKSLGVLSEMFFQYSQMQNALMEIFQNKSNKQIACWQMRKELIEGLKFHRLIFNWYKDLASVSLYPEMVEMILETTPIKFFFNVPPNEKPDREVLNSVADFQEGYLKMMLGFLKALQKRPSCKQLLKKLIKQCYQIIFHEERYTYLCAQRTLGVALLMYYDFDSTNMTKNSISDIVDLLGAKDDVKTQKYLNKVMDKLVEFQKKTYCLEYVIVPRRVAVSTNYAFFLMFTSFIYIIDKEIEIEINIYDFEEDGSFSIKGTKKSKEYSIFQKMMDETSADNKKMLKKCKQFVERQSHSMMLSQIDFKSTLKRLDGNAAKINHLFNGILNCFEGDALEVILANHLGYQGATQRILQFYRELVVLFKDQPISKFKAICQSWMSNQEVFEKFMKTEYEALKHKETSQSDGYKSSLSFLSEMTGQLLTRQNASRFRMKLCSPKMPKKWDSILKAAFSDRICKKILDFFSPIIKIFTSRQVEMNALIVSNFLRENVYLIINLYLETRFEKFKAYICQLDENMNPFSVTAILLQLNIIISMFESAEVAKVEESKEKKEEEPQSPEKIAEKSQEAKKAAKEKKEQMLKKLKQNQQKILGDKVNQKANDENEDICIICRQGSKQKEHLNFLSKVKFSTIFGYVLTKQTEPYLMISTCGHRIHESCLSQNVQESNLYASNYQCFLCKRSSNLQIPISGKDMDKESTQRIADQIRTVLSLEVSENKLLDKFVPKEKELSKLLVRSIASNVYYFSVCADKIFNARMLPLVEVLISLVKSVKKNIETENLVYKFDDVEEKKQINAIIGEIENALKKQQPFTGKDLINFIKDKKLTSKLSAKIEEVKKTPASKENDLILNIFSQPKELYELSFKARKCQSCHQTHSKLVSCLYCGFTNCYKCRGPEREHRDKCHIGVNIKIELSSGDVIYETEKGGVLTGPLYKDYAGQGFKSKVSELPKKDHYMWNEAAFNKTFEDALLGNVTDVVDSVLSRRQRQPECQIQ